jgi:hypothetical protein
MEKILAIFLTIIFATLSGFAVLWAVSPTREYNLTQSTQGIRLEGSAVFYNASDTSKPNVLHVGDLLIGDGEVVFRITEIRKSQDGTIYLIVSWKSITSYKTYAEYQAQPYRNHQTYELKAFTYDKHVLPHPELENFYKKFAQQIAQITKARDLDQKQPIQPKEEAFVVVAEASHPIVTESAPLASALVEATPTDPSRVSTEVATPTYKMAESGAVRPQDTAVQAISTTEIAVPDDIDVSAMERVEVISNEQ